MIDETTVETIELTMNFRVRMRVDVRSALRAAGILVPEGQSAMERLGEDAIEAHVEWALEGFLNEEPYIVEADVVGVDFMERVATIEADKRNLQTPQGARLPGDETTK